MSEQQCSPLKVFLTLSTCEWLVRLAHLLLVYVFCAQLLWGREVLIVHPLRLLNISAGYYSCCCRRLWVARQRFEYHDPLKTRHEELFQPTTHRPINNGQHFHHTRHRRLFHDEVGLKHSGLSQICQIWWSIGGGKYPWTTKGHQSQYFLLAPIY